MEVPMLMCSSEIWTEKKNEVTRIKVAEIRFSLLVQGNAIMDEIVNEEIRKEMPTCKMPELASENEPWKL